MPTAQFMHRSRDALLGSHPVPALKRQAQVSAPLTRRNYAQTSVNQAASRVHAACAGTSWQAAEIVPHGRRDCGGMAAKSYKPPQGLPNFASPMVGVLTYLPCGAGGSASETRRFLRAAASLAHAPRALVQ